MAESISLSSSSIDPQLFREVLGHYPTGVVMVSGIVDGQPCGMVVGTFSSVSLEPALVSFMPQLTSETYQTLRRSESVCISILAHDQMQLTRTLASKNPDKFNMIPWSPSSTGAPQIEGAVAYIHGRISQEIEAGDHWITLVAVNDLTITRPTSPLLFFQGGYGAFSTKRMTAHVDQSRVSAVLVAESARPQLERLSTELGCTAATLVKVDNFHQMIGAISYSSETPREERIGVNLPIVPPLGDVAIAWSNESVHQWLELAPNLSPEQKERYLQRIARLKTDGYGMLRVDKTGELHEKLKTIVDDYSRGELLPATERQMPMRIAEMEDLFESEFSEDEKEVSLAALSVPVFAPHSHPAMNSGLILRISDLPQRVPGTQVAQWVSTLQEAAHEVSNNLSTTSKREYERYCSTDSQRG